MIITANWGKKIKHGILEHFSKGTSCWGKGFRRMSSTLAKSVTSAHTTIFGNSSLILALRLWDKKSAKLLSEIFFLCNLAQTLHLSENMKCAFFIVLRNGSAAKFGSASEWWHFDASTMATDNQLIRLFEINLTKWHKWRRFNSTNSDYNEHFSHSLPNSS